MMEVPASVQCRTKGRSFDQMVKRQLCSCRLQGAAEEGDEVAGAVKTHRQYRSYSYPLPGDIYR